MPSGDRCPSQCVRGGGRGAQLPELESLICRGTAMGCPVVGLHPVLGPPATPSTCRYALQELRISFAGSEQLEA